MLKLREIIEQSLQATERPGSQDQEERLRRRALALLGENEWEGAEAELVGMEK